MPPPRKSFVDKAFYSFFTRNFKTAFTLAEVLITLGVIGVVAAMTLPTVISNYKKTVVENSIKKNFAIFVNAVRMSEAKYGERSEWDTCDVAYGFECSKQILEKYFLPELKVLKVCGANNKADCWAEIVSSLSGKQVPGLTTNNNMAFTAILNDGTALYMWAGAQLTNPHIQIWFDIDGPNKGKNMLGADVFGYQINFKRTTTLSLSLHMTPLTSSKSNTEDIVRNAETYGCSKDIVSSYAGYYCGGLIELNGWKIPDDYPIKF